MATTASIIRKTASEILQRRNQQANKERIKSLSFTEFARKSVIRSQSKFIPFELFPYQFKLVGLLEKYRRVEVFKSRQVGVSEVVIAHTLYKALTDPGFASLVFSIGQNESTELAKRATLLPAGQAKWERNNTRELKPSEGGTLYFRPSTSSAGRGFPSVSRLIFDEAGFIPNLAELIAASLPAQEMAGGTASTVLISTMPPTGARTYYWQSFTSGQSLSYLSDQIEYARHDPASKGFVHWEDDNGTCKVLIHRRANPLLDCSEGYLERIQAERSITLDQAIREYDLGLPRGDGSLFDPQLVDGAAVGAWAGPVQGHRYLMGVDPNFGGSDFFAVTVWDVTQNPCSLVAQYHEDRQTTERALVETLRLIQAYRPVIVAVEKNSGGQIILERLVKLAPYQRFESVVTSRQSKLQNTDRVAVGLEQGEIIFPPGWAGIDELKNFSAIDRCAAVGHDDLVMSTAIAFAWLDQCYPQTSAWGRCVAY